MTKEQKESVRRRGGGYEYYQGYAYHGNSNVAKSMKVARFTKNCNYDMPSKFIWGNSLDITNLHLYIEAQHHRSQLIIDDYEKRGMVTEIEYLAAPAGSEPPPIITISPTRLLNLLKGEERLSCRSDAVLVLTTPTKGDKNATKRFCIREFSAFLVDENYFDAELYADIINGDGDATSYRGYKQGLGKYGITPDDFHGGINVRGETRKAQPLGIETPAIKVEVGQPPEGITETVLTDKDNGSYIEKITLAIQGIHKYYIRRLLHKGIAIYAATAYDLKDRWTVYHRDAARLLALGIKE